MKVAVTVPYSHKGDFDSQKSALQYKGQCKGDFDSLKSAVPSLYAVNQVVIIKRCVATKLTEYNGCTSISVLHMFYYTCIATL